MTQPPKTARPKRFYKSVAIVDAAGGLKVELDGRSIKTPERADLIVPAPPLAVAIAAEWERQVDEIDLDAMPLTRLSQRAVDASNRGRGTMIEEIMKFSSSDLLCYRATDPGPLVERQTAEWQPVLDWAEETLGVRLEVTTALMVTEQPQTSLAALGAQVGSLSDFELAGLASAVALLGSLLLGLALHAGHIESQRALSLSLLDELWQVEQWGEDDEAAVRRERLGNDLSHLQDFLERLR